MCTAPKRKDLLALLTVCVGMFARVCACVYVYICVCVRITFVPGAQRGELRESDLELKLQTVVSCQVRAGN